MPTINIDGTIIVTKNELLKSVKFCVINDKKELIETWRVSWKND